MEALLGNALLLLCYRKVVLYISKSTGRKMVDFYNIVYIHYLNVNMKKEILLQFV